MMIQITTPALWAKANKKQQNSIYPAHWQPNFDVF
jgi:hypothetical protein